MHISTTSFHIAKGDGTETFVRQGKVFPDGHPFVKADKDHLLFEEIVEEATPEPGSKDTKKEK